MRQWLTAALVFSLFGWAMTLASPVASAAASPTDRVGGYTSGASGPLAVPYVSQLASVTGFGWRVADYACGPASAAMVAAYWSGASPAFGRAERIMGGTALVGSGSEPWQVAQAIRELAPGVSADTTAAGGPTAALSVLRGQLSLGRPVVALVHPSWFFTPINHFVVVTGLDETQGMVTFQDPMVGAQVQELTPDFLYAWAHPRHGRPFSYVWSNGGNVQPAPAAYYSVPTDSVSTVTPATALTSTATGDSTPSASPLDIGATVTVIPSGLRVHAGPSVDETVIAYLAQGDQAQVVAATGGWVRLRMADGTLGWVNSAFVTTG